MNTILRNISTQQRFFEIIDSMPNPLCALCTINKQLVSYAQNHNGVCIYEYKPTQEELESFEKRLKKYIIKGNTN